jgi:anti-anti-sigma regulatory factor
LIGFPLGQVRVPGKGMGNVDRDPASPLQADVSREGVIATVTIRGRTGDHPGRRTETCLLAVGAEHPERLAPDLDGLAFVDVTGARALDEAYRLLEVECLVILRRPRPSARNVFRMTGLIKE